MSVTFGADGISSGRTAVEGDIRPAKVHGDLPGPRGMLAVADDDDLVELFVDGRHAMLLLYGEIQLDELLVPHNDLVALGSVSFLADDNHEADHLLAVGDDLGPHGEGDGLCRLQEEAGAGEHNAAELGEDDLPQGRGPVVAPRTFDRAVARAMKVSEDDQAL